MSSFATLYQFDSEPLPRGLVRSRDPAVFQLPGSLTRGDSSIEDIHLWPMVPPRTSDARDYLKLVAATAKGMVVEAVYSVEAPAKTHSDSPLDMSLLTPTLATFEHQYRSSKFVSDDMMGDFIVEDDVVVRPLDTPKPVQAEIKSAALGYNPRIRPWDDLLNHLERVAGENERPAIQDAQDRVLDNLDNLTLSEQNVRTEILGDLLQHPQIVDIEADNQEFPEWLETLCDVRGLQRRSALSGTEATKSQELLPVYEHCLQLYVHSLPVDATDRNRVMRERMARQLAADLVLGSTVLSPQVSERTTREEANNDAVSGRGSLAGLGSGSLTQEPGNENGAAARDLALSRLGKYTTFDQEASTTAAPPSMSVSVILDHLPESINEDPNMYSYDQRNNELRIERDEAAIMSLDVREQRRLAKAAIKRQRALDRQALLSQNIQQQRQLLPGVVKSRVAPLPLRDFQSSQPAMPESSQGQSQTEIPGISMTQPEPGAFGVRPIKTRGKVKRVARVQGF